MLKVNKQPFNPLLKYSEQHIISSSCGAASTYCPNQILAMVVLSHHRVSSSKIHADAQPGHGNQKAFFSGRRDACGSNLYLCSFGGQDSKLFILIWSKDMLFQPFDIVVISEKMGHHFNLEQRKVE